jgi:hypothetical protein
MKVDRGGRRILRRSHRPSAVTWRRHGRYTGKQKSGPSCATTDIAGAAAEVRSNNRHITLSRLSRTEDHAAKRPPGKGPWPWCMRRRLTRPPRMSGVPGPSIPRHSWRSYPVTPLNQRYPMRVPACAAPPAGGPPYLAGRSRPHRWPTRLRPPGRYHDRPAGSRRSARGRLRPVAERTGAAVSRASPPGGIRRNVHTEYR